MAILSAPSITRDALIVEVDAGIARELVGLLPPGSQVDLASTAKDALELLRERPYRLLFCADDLPDIPGLMVLAETQELWPAMQRILLCADFDADFLLHALKAGNMLHYLPKPLDAGATHQLVEHALGQQRLIAELLATRSLLAARELEGPRGRTGGLAAGWSDSREAWRTFAIAVFAVIFLMAILLTAFVGWYLLKSSLGIDYFPDSHLEDLIFY